MGWGEPPAIETSTCVAGCRCANPAYGYYFCWRLREKGKSGKLQPTPARQAGLTDHTWTVEELYDMVMEHQEYQELMARASRLADRLGLN